MKHWTNAYIGIPYREFGRDRDGVDCWGLPVLVYAGELGITLPTYAGAYTSVEEHEELARHIDSVTANGAWHRVDRQPHAFDLAIFRRGRLETHVGIIVSPGLMLHVAGDDQSKLEHYNTGRWSHRLTGVYRHFEMLSKVSQ